MIEIGRARRNGPGRSTCEPGSGHRFTVMKPRLSSPTRSADRPIHKSSAFTVQNLGGVAGQVNDDLLIANPKQGVTTKTQGELPAPKPAKKR